MFDFIKYLWTNNNPWQRVGCILLVICLLFLIGMVVFLLCALPELFMFFGIIVAIFGGLAALFHFSEQWEDFKRSKRKW